MKIIFTPTHSRFAAMLLRGSLWLYVFSCLHGTIHAQSSLDPILITFDGPPTVPPGSAISVAGYTENGFLFQSINGGGFIRVGIKPDPRLPDNGTAYIQAALGDSLTFTYATKPPGSVLFSIRSVDLAEYSTVRSDAVTVRFIGYHVDGTTVTADFTTDGIIDGSGPLTDFQTFTFGPEFSNLTHLEVPTSLWSLDNLVLTIPEPGTGSLLLVGVGVLGAWFFKSKRKRGSSEK